MRITTFLSLVTLFALLGCASPQDGSTGWNGRSSAEKVGERRYIVESMTTGMVGPARLRPLLLKRAEELAIKEGVSGFVVFDPVFGRARYGESLLAEALVLLVDRVPIPRDDFEYFRVPLEVPPVPGTDSPQRVSVIGSGGEQTGREKLHVSPFYADVIDSESVSVSVVRYFLRAGPQVVGLRVLHSKGTWDAWRQSSIVLRANLQAGKRYRASGAPRGRTVEVWIEEIETKERVAQGQLVFD